MALVTYADVLPWVQTIKEQALTRQMPIWHAAHGYGAFSNDPTLTPYELSLIVAWADGTRDPAPGQTGSAGPSTARVAGARAAPGGPGTIPANAVLAQVRVRSGWVTGWTFVPGDPLITSATFTSDDGSTIGAWTAGDRPARLAAGAAIRVVSPIVVEIRRREKTAYETAFTPRESSLRFTRLPPPNDQSPPSPTRRVHVEHAACGATLGPSDATLIGVRPVLPAGASAQVTIERLGGAQPALVGWFRHFDPNYPRIYWLDRPLDFVANARLTSDAPCELDLVLSSRR
jgi:hypothetical protein